MREHWRPLKLSLLSNSVSLPCMVGAVLVLKLPNNEEDDDGSDTSDEVALKKYMPPFPAIVDVFVAGSTTRAGAPDTDPYARGRTLLNSLNPTIP